MKIFPRHKIYERQSFDETQSKSGVSAERKRHLPRDADLEPALVSAVAKGRGGYRCRAAGDSRGRA
jgi:hypothetical protein